MTGWPDIPVIYEVNTAVWLAELTRAAGEPVTLASVPDSGSKSHFAAAMISSGR